MILLDKSPDKHRLGEQLADALSFKATVLPTENKGFKLEVRVNLPLEPIEIVEDSSRVMVSATPRSYENHYSVAVLLKINPTTDVVESLLVGVR